ncbi:MAG: hypothetical protein GXO98_05925 [Nitrospirae bacterium]|nr:hypothetical protein [Nitrospirota bacterium]
MAKMWTKKEEAFLKKHYRKMSNGELAEKFSVSPESIRKKEKRLGLVREHPRRKKEKEVARPAFRKWTKKEELYLRKYYLKETNAQLAKKFKTTSKAVEKKLWRMGLKRKSKSSRLSEEERRKKIGDFLREKYQPLTVEKKVDTSRSRAIAQFDLAIKLYYAKKYKQAEKAFKKIGKEFSNLEDLVYKAKQYIKFCLEKR